MDQEIRSSIVNYCLSGLLMLLVAAPTAAATCAVPSPSYSTIQEAIDDPSCTPIALSYGVFEEDLLIGRSLALRGQGAQLSFVQGKVQVTAGTVSIIDLRIDTDANETAPALSASNGAQVMPFGVVAVSGAILFRGGFETGTPGRWTLTVP